MEKIEYMVAWANSPESLTKKVNELINNGWTCVGGHHVVEMHRQNRFTGTQHMDTLVSSNYTQTLMKYPFPRG